MKKNKLFGTILTLVILAGVSHSGTRTLMVADNLQSINGERKK